MLRLKKAQSTLEYIIVFTVIVAAVLFAANKFIKSNTQDMLEHVSGQAVKAVEHVNFQ